MYFCKSLKHQKWMFPFEGKRLIWSALEIEFFKLYFLKPVLGSHPVLSGHLAIPRGWLHNTGSTVDLYMSIKPVPLTASCISFLAILSHWNPIQCSIYRGIEVLQITAIFWHKGHTWFGRKMLFHCVYKSF